MNAFHVLSIAALVVGCGDGGPGTSGAFTPPNRGGNTTFAGSGSDRGGAPDRGGGVTPALGAPPPPDETQPVQITAPRACTTHEQCTGGRCARVGTPSYCLQACGTSACGAGYECVAGAGGSFCFARCNTAADCPRVSGLTAFCAAENEVQYCFWTGAEQS
jgi:hypothetical protein